MDKFSTNQVASKIRNFEFPFCEIDQEHKHHHTAEVCLSRQCIACFKPICYHCKFESHLNPQDSINTPKSAITQIDVIPKYRNLSKSGVILGQDSKFNYNNNTTGSTTNKNQVEELQNHEVHPIKWVLTTLNQQVESHQKLQGNSENDLWDQTEQDLQNVIDYSQRLIEKIQELQEGAEFLMEKYAMLKRQSERDERVKLVQEIITDLLDDSSVENLNKQMKALRKYIFVEKKGKITIMGEQEMIKLEKEKVEMQDNIDKYVQILQATYDEVQECLMYSHEIIKSDNHGMNWFKKYGNQGSNASRLIDSSIMTATKINSLSKNQLPKNDVSVKSVLLKNSSVSEYSFVSDASRFKKKTQQDLY